MEPVVEGDKLGELLFEAAVAGFAEEPALGCVLVPLRLVRVQAGGRAGSSVGDGVLAV